MQEMTHINSIESGQVTESPYIVSRPFYSEVEFNASAQTQIFICQGRDANALKGDVQGLYDSCSTAERHLILAMTSTQAQEQLAPLLDDVSLSSAVYLAGDETFIWSLNKYLRESGMLAEQIQAFKSSSNARQVFCCHCHSITPDVHTNPAKCGHCERLLTVTDHFSKRNVAFFGYQVNAEDPNDIPQAQELS